MLVEPIQEVLSAERGDFLFKLKCDANGFVGAWRSLVDETKTTQERIAASKLPEDLKDEFAAIANRSRSFLGL